ncbi:MAG: hypothetical protein EA394_01390, partial [Bacteroidia bacterium]
MLFGLDINKSPVGQFELVLVITRKLPVAIASWKFLWPQELEAPAGTSSFHRELFLYPEAS